MILGSPSWLSERGSFRRETWRSDRVQHAVLQGFGEVAAIHRVSVGEIGDGPRDAQHPQVPACRQRELLARSRQELLPFAIEAGLALRFVQAEPRVELARQATLHLAACLPLPCPGHEPAGRLRVLGGFGAGSAPGAEVCWRQHDVQVESIEQGPRDLAPVPAPRFRCAATRDLGVTEVPARAGVHGADELGSGGECRLHLRADDVDLMILERLPQGFERAAPELGQLVEEEDAVVGQADLAGPWLAPPSNQASLTDGVVRCPERALGHDPTLCLEQPCDAVDRRRFERLAPIERRQ